MSAKKTTAVVKHGQFEILGLNLEAEDLLAPVKENLGEGGNLRFTAFRTLKIPTGGETEWKVPSMLRNKTAKVVRGVILAHREKRGMWLNPQITFDRPDCSSPDAIHGFGIRDEKQQEPTSQLCETCPWSQWGSKNEATRAQRCTHRKWLFVLLDDRRVPMLISAPPGSLGAARDYLLDVAEENIPFWRIVTEFRLKEAQGPVGPYAQIDFSAAAEESIDECRLSPAQVEKVEKLRPFFIALLKEVNVEFDDTNPAAVAEAERRREEEAEAKVTKGKTA